MPRKHRAGDEETWRLKAETGSPWPWVARPLNAEWEIAYRVVVQDGEVLIGELRCYPSKPGKWGGERDPRARIPDHGLTARLVRQIKVGSERELANTIIEKAKTDPVMIHLLRERGFDAVMQSRGRGGRALDPMQYALLAERYVELRLEGQRAPVQRIAEELGLERKTVRHRLHIARTKLGFLTQGKRGKVAGELTPECRTLLRKRRKLTGVPATASTRKRRKK